ncbi:MAG: endonuclease MutS2 [Campylobacteraceae bacterium]|nr:endonuclease MutS2 [Campylobacteraceae bacterium]
MEEIINKLDLDEYIKEYKKFLAREKPLFIEGDSNIHYRFINELQKYDIALPQNVENIDTSLVHLSKSGVLHIKEIFEIVKIIRYFLYLKKQKFEDSLKEWMINIKIPESILEVERYFDEKGVIKDSIDERFLNINANLKSIKESINAQIRQFFSSLKLQSYLVDRQVHFLNNQEALLVRGGFNHILKGSVVGRSSNGYFYVVPESLDVFKKKESELLDKKEELIYEYSKKISNEFSKNLLFLKYINKEFDRFDNYIARVMLAKSKNMEFVLPSRDTKIKLENFSHPALNDPKPLSVEFDKKILLVTGVNAGGKTMLLKSILSAVILAKYLLPMKIKASSSHIGSFKGIEAIIEDPQNIKNDISTFAGRMLSFSKLFSKNNILVGVDEIELGTDADEAANLFCAILENLIKKDIKLIITTHHKRLASMFAVNDNVEFLAALYDEKRERPNFTFLKGTIGKSYAFETAKRYGIPPNIVSYAKELYGEDKEKLGNLIQKNIDLELELRLKLKNINVKEEKIKKLTDSLETIKEEQMAEFNSLKNRYELDYEKAITFAKEAAKEKVAENIHKAINKAHLVKTAIKPPEIKRDDSFEVGSRIKYGNFKGVIKAIKKDILIADIDGITMQLPKHLVKKISSNTPKITKSSNNLIQLERPQNASVVLDLHGLRADEAIEKLDKFISDALMSGFDEVQIFHGVGSGKLAFAVKNFLKEHPSVKSFNDAPANQGGIGATIVKF